MEFYWKSTRHFLRSVSENAAIASSYSGNSFNINNTDNNNLLNLNEMSFLIISYKKTHNNRKNNFKSNYGIR